MNVYTDYHGLHYYNTKQKLNSRYILWYLCIYKFIYQINYKPSYTIVKPDGLPRCSGKENSGMDGHVFNEGQLLDHDNDNVGEEEDVEDVELERIDMATWEQKNEV